MVKMLARVRLPERIEVEPLLRILPHESFEGARDALRGRLDGGLPGEATRFDRGFAGKASRFDGAVIGRGTAPFERWATSGAMPKRWSWTFTWE